MKRKKGRLPGRYVPPHIRRWPNQPAQYLNVAAYQENIEPAPAEFDRTPPQGELELAIDAAIGAKSSEGADENSSVP